MLLEIGRGLERRGKGAAEHEGCGARAMGEFRSLWGVMSSHWYVVEVVLGTALMT